MVRTVSGVRQENDKCWHVLACKSQLTKTTCVYEIVQKDHYVYDTVCTKKSTLSGPWSDSLIECHPAVTGGRFFLGTLCILYVHFALIALIAGIQTGPV